MEERILSPEEIDALMKGVFDGEVETGGDIERGAIEADDYSLISGSGAEVSGGFPMIEVINDRFCTHFKDSLSTLIGKETDVNATGVSFMKFSEYITAISHPAGFNIFSLSPLDGQGLLFLDAGFIFSVLDSYFGGSGVEAGQAVGREFSVFEERVIKKLSKTFFTDMQRAWNALFALEFIYERMEVNPRFINIVAPSDTVIVSSFCVEIEGRLTRVSLLIPYSSIEPVKGKLSAAYYPDEMKIDKRWAEMFAGELRKTDIGVSGEIGSVSLPIGDFLSLNIGDTVMLDKKLADRAVVKVEGASKWMGTVGMSAGQYSIKVEELIDNGGE